MNRIIAINALACLLVLTACSEQKTNSVPAFNKAEQQTAGAMTHKRLHNNFIHPGKGVSNTDKLDFWTGFSFFRDPWVAAPSATGNRDGLGPIFNSRSCIACHTAGARAKLDKTGEVIPLSLVVRLGSKVEGNNAVDPVYGGQIQPRKINYQLAETQQKNSGEAWLAFGYSKVVGKFSDGESYELLKPNYKLTQLAYGELAPHVGLSVRLAPNIFGMGLLNAISEKDLLAQEDIDDANGDGISAKYNRVPNVITGKIELGRFGLKAKQPNLHQQVAAAFRDDIGITNSSFPKEVCTSEQVVCRKASLKGGHNTQQLEIDDVRLGLVVTFNELIGVPSARNLQDKKVQQGRDVFYQLKCHQCHTPSYVTAQNPNINGNHGSDALAGQLIWPYTDLALHDMGSALADGVFEFNATGNEWRTPPLWGIGLQEKMTGEQRFLHDGRARTISEAILWHGGEAEKAKQDFKKLSKQQRQVLIQFVRAI